MPKVVIDIKPSLRQAQAWEYLQDYYTRYVLYGGAAGGGKTWLSCEWLLVLAFNFDHTRYFAARNELKKLRESWLMTFYKVLRYHGIDAESILKFNGQDNYIQFHNGSRIDLVDLQLTPGDPFYERLGSIEYTCGVIEEAGEVEHAAFDVLKSRIGRCENDRHGLKPKILLSCNPKRNWLFTEFVKPWREGTLPDNMKFVPALVTDNTFVDSNYIGSLQSISDKTMRARLLEGEWDYDANDNALIEPAALTDVFSKSVSAKVAAGTRYLTCDIARLGKDNTVVIEWLGLRADKIHIWSKQDIVQSAKKIREIASTEGINMSRIIVDSDGVGGGVSDILFGCTQFMNNARPLNVRGRKENFANLKSQCYYKLSELINNRQLFINEDNIERRNRISEELEQVKISDPDSDGKMTVMSKKLAKKALGRSPDISDALMMRMQAEIRNVQTIRIA